jgi:hypothetical protein
MSATTTKRPVDSNKDERKQKEKRTEDERLEEGVEETFPASDPVSETQPGGGITGPEVIDPKKKR